MLQSIYGTIIAIAVAAIGAVDAHLGAILLVLAVFVGVLAVFLWFANLQYKASGEVVPMIDESQYEINRDNIDQVMEHQIMHAMHVPGYEKDHPAIELRKVEQTIIEADAILDPRD